jgi:nucleoside-diphosphate kinase
VRSGKNGSKSEDRLATSKGSREHAETLADFHAALGVAQGGNYNKGEKQFKKERIPVPQRTFSIVKPDAVRKGFTGAILGEIAKAGFQIVAIKKQSISKAEAEGFYAVHKERPFFGDLCTFMSSGPLVLMVLEKDNAIADLRKLMGATNPANAEEGTIRKKFAGSIQENAIHGSDAAETAAFEIGYWFAGYELI